MYLFAAVSAMEKIKELPPEIWFKIAMGVVILVAVVVVVRRAAKTNKVIMGVAAFVVVTILFFSWVYNRNEPKFLTPLVNKIAPFFPSASSYSAKQKTPPKS